ncbi:hypothetical protein B4U80_14296 [Leptotrombidium deliense]|uniref:NTR domain-containing protein n=1 Tax=Leptotrombidium deliense TaxID=299467 RepID=A0A443RY70_9ACAR|nr:hypothetical protein B4U80_14296 [Leptotrombidium deliense]
MIKITLYCSIAIVFGCLCTRETTLQTFCRSEVVAIVNTNSVSENKFAYIYNITMGNVIKTQRDIDGVKIVATSKEPGLCGIKLEYPAIYVVTGVALDNGYEIGKTSISVNQCSYIRKWNDLSAEQKSFVENFKQTQCA